MVGTKRTGSDNKKTNITQNYEVGEIMEDHDHPRPEGARHIEVDFIYSRKEYFSNILM